MSKRLMILIALCGCGGGTREEPAPMTPSQHVLEEFAAILNRNIPEFRDMYDPTGFAIVEGKPVNFFVVNLVDTTNAFPPDPFDPGRHAPPSENPFVLNERGLFHFAPLRLDVSFSHIAVLENEQVTVFSFVNCQNRGESIRDVVEHITSIGSYDDAVMARVRNYRSYGTYFQTDPQIEVKCE